MLQYKKPSFMCKCSKISDTAQEFGLHYRNNHTGVAQAEILENDVYMCTVCDDHFGTAANCERHQKEKHPKENDIIAIDEKPPFIIADSPTTDDRDNEESDFSARLRTASTPTTARPTSPAASTSSATHQSSIDRPSHKDLNAIPHLTSTADITTAPPVASDSRVNRRDVSVQRVADLDCVKSSTKQSTPHTPKTTNSGKKKAGAKRPAAGGGDRTKAAKTTRQSVRNESVDKLVCCNVCNKSADSNSRNVMISCDGCDVCVHQHCYGRSGTYSPEYSWYCDPCKTLGHNVQPTCILCPNKGGAMKCSKDGQTWAHVSCVQFHDMVFLAVGDGGRCYLCSKFSGGHLECNAPDCTALYHVTCALRFKLDVVLQGSTYNPLMTIPFCALHSNNSTVTRLNAAPKSTRARKFSKVVMLPYKKQSYLCSTCAKIVDTPQKFAHHHRNNHDGAAQPQILDNDVFMCSICDHHFSSAENCRRHEQETHSDSKENDIVLVDQKPPFVIADTTTTTDKTSDTSPAATISPHDNHEEESELSTRAASSTSAPTPTTAENGEIPNLTETTDIAMKSSGLSNSQPIGRPAVVRHVAYVASVKLPDEQSTPHTQATVSKTMNMDVQSSDTDSEEDKAVEKPDHCDVCKLIGSKRGKAMILVCDACNVGVHQGCYGVGTVPKGSWYCTRCNQHGHKVRPSCVLCPNVGGAMKCSKDGQTWAHVSCVLLIDEAFFENARKLDHINTASVPKKLENRKCFVCDKTDGAFLKCTIPECTRGYHVTCALNHRDKFEVQMKNASNIMKSIPFCVPHSDKQLRSLEAAVNVASKTNAVVNGKRSAPPDSSMSTSKRSLIGKTVFSNVTFLIAVANDDFRNSLAKQFRSRGAGSDTEDDLDSYDYVIVSTFMKDTAFIDRLRATATTKLSKICSGLWAELCLMTETLLPSDMHQLYRPLVVTNKMPLENVVVVIQPTLGTAYSQRTIAYLRHLIKRLGAVCQGFSRYDQIENGKSLRKSTHYVAAYDDERHVGCARSWNMQIITHSWLVQTAIEGVKPDCVLHSVTKDTNVCISDTSLTYRRTDEMWKKVSLLANQRLRVL